MNADEKPQRQYRFLHTHTPDLKRVMPRPKAMAMNDHRRALGLPGNWSIDHDQADLPAREPTQQVRPADEIQLAHDTLIAIVMDWVPTKLSASQRQNLCLALDALCWVLGHDHNTRFGDVLRETVRAIEASGYKRCDRNELAAMGGDTHE